MVVRDIARALHFLHNKGGWGSRPAGCGSPPRGVKPFLCGEEPHGTGGGTQPFPASGSGWAGGYFGPYMRVPLFVLPPPLPSSTPIGIAHRDLKPENILCESPDQVSGVRVGGTVP